MLSKRGLCLWLIFFCFWGILHATHNRAGEITYRHISGFTYEATITTYTKSDSPADRPALPIHWGDGTVDTIPRINGAGNGVMVSANIKKNIYIGIHTYPGNGIYNISMEDPNRNQGIVNIPNSINIPFFISSQLVINPFFGPNQSVQLLNPPLDNACAGQVFFHNPAAFDPDGDSISYRLVVCKGENGADIPGFQLPQSTNFFSLNVFTGDLIWDSPPINGAGEYNVAFVVEEWRNGVRLGMVTRDMQITVVPCTNIPPQMPPLPDYCVVAGNSLQFSVTANDASNQSITLEAFGGPFTFAPPGQAVFPTIIQNGSVTQQFSWTPACSSIRQQPYQITFKATDSGQPVQLVTFATTRIRVIAPPPVLQTPEPQSNGILVSWQPSNCQQVKHYKLYRRVGPSNWTPGPCETGIPSGLGYSLVYQSSDGNTFSYFDDNQGLGLTIGQAYCYRVLAIYAEGAESIASNELCAELNKSLPIPLRHSIANTSTANGLAEWRWQGPFELDTMQHTGPYMYYLLASLGFTGGQEVLIDSLSGPIDQSFNFSLGELNTVDTPHRYRIDFWNVAPGNRYRIGVSQSASSVFLQINPGDNQLQLNWQWNVPWQVDSTRIYRKGPADVDFNFLQTIAGASFTDVGLPNGVSYCYKVETIGRYGSAQLPSPSFNFSQEVCAAAIDLEPPCTPMVQVLNDCESISNTIQWNFASDTCLADCFRVELIFQNPLTNAVQLVHTWPCEASNEPWEHTLQTSLAGCYSAVAIDSAGNIAASAAFCVDNCPVFELPNIISPNGDGLNELFMPIAVKFIDRMQINIFNRWGQEVFSSQSPDFAWNGRVDNTGASCPDGVYFVVGEVWEIRLEGLVKRAIRQTLQIVAQP